MKATVALLANTEVHNQVRKLSWDIHQKYRTGIDICRLPPHISLKQPFDIFDPGTIEAYMTELASSVSPFQINLTHLELIETTIDGSKTGILWLNVEETAVLRQLHNRVNEELKQRFENVPADFDGADYHFHMTVSLGGQPIEIYRGILEYFSNRIKNIQFLVKELVMFIYDDRYSLNAGYMTYRVTPLGGSE